MDYHSRDNGYRRHRGGGGGRHYNRRGGGRYNDRRNGGGGYQGGGYHGGGPNRNRGPRRPHPSNRFDNQTESVDPQTGMVNQLKSMVSKMSDLIQIANKLQEEGGSSVSSGDDSRQEENIMIKQISQNIQGLTEVMCKEDNAGLFLKYTPRAADAKEISAKDEAGTMASLISSVTASFPMQTPSYVGLTLAIEENAPEATEPGGLTFKGFAGRCVAIACQRLVADLDKMCGVISLLDSSLTVEPCTESSEDGSVDAYLRAKLLLRYLALLARVGIVRGFQEGEGEEEEKPWEKHLSVLGLLKVLVGAATCAIHAAGNDCMDASTRETYRNAAYLVTALVLSTIPYTVQYIPQKEVDALLTSVQELLNGYLSAFQPGGGSMAILLRKELTEEGIGEAEESDEEEEEDEEEDSSAVCADTLQDLLRTVQKMVATFYDKQEYTSRFSLLTDAPWRHLETKKEEYAPMPGDAEDEMTKSTTAKLSYTGKDLYITIPENGLLIPYLFSLGRGEKKEDSSGNTYALVLNCHSLEGVLFGRLSIFDLPPEVDGDEEEEEESDLAKNENATAYINTFSLMDRYFLSESVRDCLICHRPTVSNSGLAKGSSKDVAEQVWSLSYLFHPAETASVEGMDDGISTTTSQLTNPSKGIEYGLVETILSLIVQSPRGVDSTSPLSHVYLSRVLLELTKFQPSRVPQSLAVALSVLFNDFAPSLSPIALENLSCWFAFHLNNTDYQWPHTYWNAWTPFVTKGMTIDDSTGLRKRNSRGEFVTNALHFLSSLTSTPEIIVTDCLPIESDLANYVICLNAGSRNLSSGQAMTNLLKSIEERIWVSNEDPEAIQNFILGDEVSESMSEEIESSSMDSTGKTYWRSGLLAHSLLHPVAKDFHRLEAAISNCRKNNDDNMVDDITNSEEMQDTLNDIEDILGRYKPVLSATMTKDIQIHEEALDFQGEAKKKIGDILLAGETNILRQLQNVVSYSNVQLQFCVESCVRQGILSAKSVISWVLGEFSPEISNPAAKILPCWWNLASPALRAGVANLLSDEDDTNSSSLNTDGDIGMIIDRGEVDDTTDMRTPSIRRMKKVTDFVTSVLNHAFKLVDQLLKEIKSEDNKSFTHAEADLQEGLKYLSRSTKLHIATVLKKDSIVAGTNELGGAEVEVENWLAKCDFKFL